MVKLTSLLLRRAPEYWKRYTERWMNAKSKPARYVPLRGWVGEDRRSFWIHTDKLPSSAQNHMENADVYKGRFLIEEELIEPIRDWTIQLGDRVEILVGRDKGSQGIVSRIVYQRNWVFVEGLNTQIIKQDRLNGQPIQREEMPLDVSSEVALVDPVTEKACTKVEWRYTESGVKVRLVFPSQVILQATEQHTKQEDGVNPKNYTTNVATDTGEKELEEDNYVPKMKTFEQDILDSMGIKDTRKRGKTYWY